MRRPKPRHWWMASLLVFFRIGDEPTSGQAPPQGTSAPVSIHDPRLEPLRKASSSWESRPGPARAVVDQVCLVPDLPSFLEAIASWDRGHYFPILFDDVESSFRFIRAFKPARIVRLPKSATPIPAGTTWRRAVDAVGASWAAGNAPHPPGDAAPKGLGPTPPGVVLSSPAAGMLAGAVALAAGRFQPLLRLDLEKRSGDVLSLAEVEEFDRSIAETVGGRIPNHGRLGDDCDFLTIAGDWPYRYRDAKGEQDAVDDKVGRSAGSDRRWAFAGRLLGDATESAYRAMSSLFLQPESALMFNGYDEAAQPWSFYSMRASSLRLSAAVPTSQVSGDSEASLEGWHEAFDPTNRFGLVVINSHGSPTEFNLRGGPAHAPDIPRGVPSAVLMIHSFSAADPNDPSTVAGRWLANGAFVFFGSMNEPFLDAFRLPRLVSDLIAQGLPLVAAVRQAPDESRGLPWRLVFLGDPLYRIKPRTAAGPTPRLGRWDSTASWPSYAATPRPDGGPDADLFLWSLKTALARLQGATAGADPGDDLVDSVVAIRREALPAAFRPIHDALLTEVLLQARKRTSLKAALAAIPEGERTASVRRTLETILAIDFHLALARKDPSKAWAAWLDLMKTGATREFKQQATSRAGRLADTASRRGDWGNALRAALADRPRPSDAEVIAAELRRVGDAGKSDR